MKIAVDFDGVIAKDFKWNAKYPVWLLKLMLLLAPAMPNLNILRALIRHHEVIVVTSRPQHFLGITRLWLWLHQFPVVNVFCVGTGGKARTLVQERAKLFIDDKQKYINEAQEAGVRAVLFRSWRAIAEQEQALGFGRYETLPWLHKIISTSMLGIWCKKWILKRCMKSGSAHAIREQLFAHLEHTTVQTVTVNRERVELHEVIKQFTAFHVTSRIAAEEILHTALTPSLKYETYADKAHRAPVLFIFPIFAQAKHFTLLSLWPRRLFFDFITEKKTTILEVTIPEGHRIGITSWGEIVAIEAVDHKNIRLL